MNIEYKYRRVYKKVLSYSSNEYREFFKSSCRVFFPIGKNKYGINSKSVTWLENRRFTERHE